MADLLLVRSYDVAPPFFVFGTQPEPSDTKWLLLTLAASTNRVTTKMVNNYNKMHSNTFKNKNEIGLMTSMDEFYFHWEMYGHTNVELPKIQNNKKSMATKEMLKYPIIRSLMYKLYNPQFKLEYISYQQYLYKTLMKNTFKSQSELNHDYTLFLHCVTNPNGPQIWRKVRINGRLNMKQVDEILRHAITYQIFGTAHMTEFRINFNDNKLTKKISIDTDENIRNELVIFDTKNISDYADGMVYRAFRANCTAPMNKIYFGQIADLFLNKNKDYNHDSIPYDPFYDKYYGKQMFPFPNTKRYKIMDKNVVKKNFSYIKNDCIQYVYDWGEEWCWNIYVIDKKQNKTSHNNYKSLSRFIDGKCIIPPNDIAGMEGFKRCLEKCHYDPYALEMSVGDFKHPNDIYSWMGNTLGRYFDFGCLMGQNNHQIRHFLILFFQNNQSVDDRIRKKIIYQLESGQPFWFPYREMPEIQSHLNKLNKVYHKKWWNKIKTYKKRNKGNECGFCHDKHCKLKTCKRCESVRYCSRKCQKRDWRMHKTNCI